MYVMGTLKSRLDEMVKQFFKFNIACNLIRNEIYQKTPPRSDFNGLKQVLGNITV